MVDDRRTSRAHCALAASTISVPASSRTDVSRSSAGPTAARHANETLPGESGASLRSSERAPGSAEVSGRTSRILSSAVRLKADTTGTSITMRLVLASASPRRAELLRAAGYTFDTLAVDLDERVKPGETPDVYVARLAREKSAA